MYRKLTMFLVVALIMLVSGCTDTVPRDRPPEEAAAGVLNISSTPPGSGVYLDGRYMGTTPITILDVAGGSHILELRSRDYNPWSKSLEIRGGSISYVDAALSPVVIQTSIPTTIATTKPTPIPTTKPVPKTIAGCWEFEKTTGDTTITYTYELESGGTGWMAGTKTTPLMTESMHPMRVTWSIDPSTSVVRIVEASPKNPADPVDWVLIYDKQADILDGGKKGESILAFERVPC